MCLLFSLLAINFSHAQSNPIGEPQQLEFDFGQGPEKLGTPETQGSIDIPITAAGLEFVPTSSPGVMRKISDGKNYLMIPDKETGSHRPVLLETATAEDIRAVYIQNDNLRTILKNAVRIFPADLIQFSGAQVIIQMTACFGSGLAGLEASDPVCVDNLIKTLTDPAGIVGFFGFVVANRISSKYLNNALVSFYTLAGQQRLTPSHMRTLRPLVGYIGMAFGSAASQVISHIANLPTAGKCLGSLSRGELPDSQHCKDMIEHFASADRFWNDFAAGLPALIGSAIVATATQRSVDRFTTLFVSQGLDQKIRTEGLGAALRSTDIKSLKILPNLVRIGARWGSVVVISHPMGHMVLFLAWEHVFRAPSFRWSYHAWDKGNIRTAIANYMKSAAYIKNNGLTRARTQQNCQLVPKDIGEAIGYNAMGDFPLEMVERCEREQPLAMALAQLLKHGNRYRQKVVISDLETYATNYRAKWQAHIQSYIIGKDILHKSFASREKLLKDGKSPQVSNPFLLYILNRAWQAAIPVMPTDIKLNQILARSEKFNLNKKFRDLDQSITYNRENEVEMVDILKDLRDHAAKTYGHITRIPTYSYHPLTKRVLMLTLQMPQDLTNRIGHSEVADLLMNTATLESMNQNQVARRILSQMICGTDKKVTATNTNILSGSGSELRFPNILAQADPALTQACSTYGTYAIPFPYYIDDKDNSPVFRILRFLPTTTGYYVDPLMLLADPQIPLAVGSHQDQVNAWWKTHVDKEVIQFYGNFIKAYQRMIRENLMTKVDTSPASELLKKSWPFNQPAEWFRKMTNITHSWNPLHYLSSRWTVPLNQSLIGEMQVVLEGAKLIFMSQPTAQRQENELVLETIKGIELEFAQHTRLLKMDFDSSKVDTQIESALNELTSKGDISLRNLSANLTTSVFGQARTHMTERSVALREKINVLSAIWLGKRFERFNNAADKAKYLEATPEKVSAFTDEEYKIYTGLLIISHLMNLLEEVNGYYYNYIYLNELYKFDKDNQ
ncbi:MAG: hypothetical protein K2Q26_02645 [Bdellovibrionales bacterium]|nr:hypothetical protein [Bdellovibrionales bacterium]